MELKIYLEEQEEGGYTVFVPALPGCISQGDSVEESVENIREAILLYLDEEPNDFSGKGKIIDITI
jgi:predicted RNase H-like HicB family nuclease